MRSVLEHEPELVSGIGLITVRWASLEAELADLLDQLLRVRSTGPDLYYALGSFSQRIDMVEAAIRSALAEPRHARIAAALFGKIRRLWKTRNYLIHSRYVYAEDGLMLIGLGMRLGEHPRNRFPNTPERYGPHHPRTVTPRFRGKGNFAYERRSLDGTVTYVPVNKGSFQGHADQLSKRIRQIRALVTAIRRDICPLRRGAVASQRKPHPRSRPRDPATPTPPTGG